MLRLWRPLCQWRPELSPATQSHLRHLGHVIMWPCMASTALPPPPGWLSNELCWDHWTPDGCWSPHCSHPVPPYPEWASEAACEPAWVTMSSDIIIHWRAELHPPHQTTALTLCSNQTFAWPASIAFIAVDIICYQHHVAPVWCPMLDVTVGASSCMIYNIRCQLLSSHHLSTTNASLSHLLTLTLKAVSLWTGPDCPPVSVSANVSMDWMDGWLSLSQRRCVMCCWCVSHCLSIWRERHWSLLLIISVSCPFSLAARALAFKLKHSNTQDIIFCIIWRSQKLSKLAVLALAQLIRICCILTEFFGKFCTQSLCARRPAILHVK